MLMTKSEMVYMRISPRKDDMVLLAPSSTLLLSLWRSITVSPERLFRYRIKLPHIYLRCRTAFSIFRRELTNAASPIPPIACSYAVFVRQEAFLSGIIRESFATGICLLGTMLMTRPGRGRTIDSGISLILLLPFSQNSGKRPLRFC